MSIQYRIDFGDLENNAAVIEWYQRFAAECTRRAQALAAARISGGTGLYERSFEFQLLPGSPPTLVFGNSAPHAIYVEEDTEAHVVRPTPPGRKSFTNPNREGMLRWFNPPGGGASAAVFAREAHIPARAGRHIIRDAVSETGDSLRAS